MTDDEKQDWAVELQKIAGKIDKLSNDLTEDKYSQAIGEIKTYLEKCKNELDYVIKNLG